MDDTYELIAVLSAKQVASQTHRAQCRLTSNAVFIYSITVLG